MILVVDDDEAARGLIEQRLRHQGFPTASGSSREAIGMLHSGGKPCLLLLDVIMPGEAGWDLIERLLRNPTLNDVPVVLMSAHPTALQAYRRVRGGERASLLTKPLDMKRLVSLAASHCRCRLPAANSP